ncbi:endonuclease/exonuclease/phosphatase family protein [Candidatus Uabimicrobium helgolandensis]
MKILRYISLALLGVVSLSAGTEKYRLVWSGDPATTMTIAWNQISGDTATVYYGQKKDPSDWLKQNVDREIKYRGMSNKFVRLKNLQPNTPYYFRIKDNDSESSIMWFQTAPNTPQPFTFIAGGDSRTNKEPRINGNKLIAKIRPLFIAHGGDYLNDGTAEEWQMWLDEWQLTKSEDGRMYPIIPAHGNHENDDRDMIYNLFDIPNKDAYFSCNIAGDLLRLYTLNTELEPGVGYGAFKDQDDRKWKEQNEWFVEDLKNNHDKAKWKIVNYHRPLRPHTSAKSEGLGRITAWAESFYKYGVNVAVECDTHMVKYTYPLRPSIKGFESFARDDKKGTVFIGEGSWGAPTRSTDDDKPWTLASDSFWQYKLLHVTPKTIKIRTVRFGQLEEVERGIHYDGSEVKSLTQEQQNKNPLIIPEGLTLWNPLSGKTLELPFTAQNIDHNTYIHFGDEWKYLAQQEVLEGWQQLNFDDQNWQTMTTDTVPQKKVLFLRKKFTVSHEKLRTLRLNLRTQCSDGVVIFCNGKEIARYNTTEEDPVTALRQVEDINTIDIPLPVSTLQPGENCLSAMLVQYGEPNANWNIDLSSIVTLKDLNPPQMPGSFSANVLSDKETNLSWEGSANYFQLERRKENGIWKVIKQRIYIKNYQDRALAGNTSYQYRIFAISGNGVSNPNYIKVATYKTPANVILQENFTKGLGQFNSISAASNANWEAKLKADRLCALISGYGADADSNDWLVSPEIDLRKYKSPKITFDIYTKYAGGKLQIEKTCNYNDKKPQDSIWKNLAVNLPGEDSRKWTTCSVDLAEFNDSKIRIAFHYTSGTTGGNAARWCITNIEVRDGEKHKFSPKTVIPQQSSVSPKSKDDLRVATFNASLYRNTKNQLSKDLQASYDPQIKNIAETIQRVKADILLINEFDYVADGSAVEHFKKNYLQVSHNGSEIIDYPYYYIAESNTGIDSGYDLNNDGHLGGPDDAFGYGAYPGQYSFVVLSKYPIDNNQIRTFQKFLWKDMPEALLPKNPQTNKPWYSSEEMDVFRLSSKNHCDVPINVNGQIIHILASHPTPPVFDGEEDRNGKRNHDEIRFWYDYINPKLSSYIYDDKGKKGGFSGKQFVVAGDLNASPTEREAIKTAINKLISSHKTHNHVPQSEGGKENDQGNIYSPAHTAGWKLRVDYVIPSSLGFKVKGGQVFWPTLEDKYYRLVSTPEENSDHRLVYVDLEVEVTE